MPKRNWKSRLLKSETNGIGVFDMSREDCKNARMQKYIYFAILQPCILDFGRNV